MNREVQRPTNNKTIVDLKHPITRISLEDFAILDPGQKIIQYKVTSKQLSCLEYDDGNPKALNACLVDL